MGRIPRDPQPSVYPSKVHTQTQGQQHQITLLHKPRPAYHIQAYFLRFAQKLQVFSGRRPSSDAKSHNVSGRYWTLCGHSKWTSIIQHNEGEKPSRDKAEVRAAVGEQNTIVDRSRPGQYAHLPTIEFQIWQAQCIRSLSPHRFASDLALYH